MKTFPMFLRTTGRRILVIGGGEQSAQKIRLALKTDAEIVLVASEPEAELRHLIDQGRIQHAGNRVDDTLLENRALTFVATGCKGADAAFHAIVAQGQSPVNVVDSPELCDAITPAIVDRDPVVVAIGTAGTAPVLARQIKSRLEQWLEPQLGEFAALAGRLRDAVSQYVEAPRRRAFWRWVFAGEPRQQLALGAMREASRTIKSAIRNGGAPTESDTGLVSLVGAGPGSVDLITLRGVQRLQEADIIFYDRLVDPKLLELARRDAERVFVGKEVGTSEWPQDRINGVVLAAARQGKRVVRLKSGDPSIFGRAAEEIEVLKRAGITFEIVPGVTSACAAAAEVAQPLTVRGQTQAVTFITGQCTPGGSPPDWAAHLLPGTTLAIYMGAKALPEIQDQLLCAGLPEFLEVQIIVNTSKHSSRSIVTNLKDLTLLDEAWQAAAPAVILVNRPAVKNVSLDDLTPEPILQSIPHAAPCALEALRA